MDRQPVRGQIIVELLIIITYFYVFLQMAYLMVDQQQGEKNKIHFQRNAYGQNKKITH